MLNIICCKISILGNESMCYLNQVKRRNYFEIKTRMEELKKEYKLSPKKVLLVDKKIVSKALGNYTPFYIKDVKKPINSKIKYYQILGYDRKREHIYFVLIEDEHNQHPEFIVRD